MAYSTEADVLRVLVGRRDEVRNETPAELDVDQIRYAIADADAQINLALKRRYVVPFPDGSVPTLVKGMSINIAAYLSLLIWRGSNAVGTDDPLFLLYDRSRRMLDAIQQGRADVEGATPLTSLDDAVPAVYNEYPEPLFPLYPTFEEGYIPADKLYK